jgi:hypothetical protein
MVGWPNTLVATKPSPIGALPNYCLAAAASPRLCSQASATHSRLQVGVRSSPLSHLNLPSSFQTWTLPAGRGTSAQVTRRIWIEKDIHCITTSVSAVGRPPATASLPPPRRPPHAARRPCRARPPRASSGAQPQCRRQHGVIPVQDDLDPGGTGDRACAHPGPGRRARGPRGGRRPRARGGRHRARRAAALPGVNQGGARRRGLCGQPGVGAATAASRPAGRQSSAQHPQRPPVLASAGLGSR